MKTQNPLSQIKPYLAAWRLEKTTRPEGITNRSISHRERLFWGVARTVMETNPKLGHNPVTVALPENLVEKRRMVFNLGRDILTNQATDNGHLFWHVVAATLKQQPLIGQ